MSDRGYAYDSPDQFTVTRYAGQNKVHIEVVTPVSVEAALALADSLRDAVAGIDYMPGAY